MCGINGLYSNTYIETSELTNSLSVMNSLIKHRGPDGDGIWLSNKSSASLGLGHVRLSIIDLSNAANQPLIDEYGNVIVFNGEIYNYIELKEQLKAHWQFRTSSDTEVILAAYHHYGISFIDHLEGMFSFALWDVKLNKLIIVRDRVGIKPLYYFVKQDCNKTQLYFSSEVKALLPFTDSININPIGMTEYLLFQYPLNEDLLITGIKQLMPGHMLVLANNKITITQYWDIEYRDKYTDSKITQDHFKELMADATNKHLRSDVPLGAYLSGGIDSSLVTLLANKHSKSSDPNKLRVAVNGRFQDDPTHGVKALDESKYAACITDAAKLDLDIVDISIHDFIKHITDINYYLDYPVAGPGSFPQYLVSKQAKKHVKVMLGGQGGDELFGGYARYILMYFDQITRQAIDGDLNNPNLKPNYQNIFQQLATLQQYKPLYQQFMKQDCFADYSQRYYALINKADDYSPSEINWQDLPVQQVYSKYERIFNSAKTEQPYLLNQVLHFDFKCLLPALLHVEDRVSMANGIESRVPMLDHRVVEFAAGISPEVKFANSEMKGFLKSCYADLIPDTVLNRKDKMGFPVPLNQWVKNGELKSFITDILSSQKSQHREFINYQPLLQNLSANQGFSRKLWGMLNLELWFQNFYDKHHYYKKLVSTNLKSHENINIV